MRVREAKLGLAVLALAGLAVGLFLQHQRLSRLRAENAALRAQAGELAALQPENQRRGNRPSAAAETARLHEQQAELLRLRGEVTRLRNQARQDPARGATAGSLPPVAPADGGQPEPDPTPFTVAANVNVSSGETFATGGWLTSPGLRTFFLATPSLGVGAADDKTINVSMCLIKVSEADLPETLLRKLRGQPQAESSVLTGTEAQLLMSKLNSGEGTNVISRPQIVTSDGVPASMFIGESRPNSDGTQRQLGTKIDLSPQIAQDGQTIQMRVNLEYVPREEKDDSDTPAQAN